MDGKDHVACFVGEYCVVLGGSIVLRCLGWQHS